MGRLGNTGAFRLALLWGAVCGHLLVGHKAQALIVKTYNGPGTPNVINTSAPADDPGWHNVPSNRSGVYLGNQWVLTAAHASEGDVDLPGGTYSMIPGTTVTLTNPGFFNGQSLDSFSDLKLFRIDTHPSTGLTPEQQDPNVQEITLATERPTAGTTNGTEVLMIGAGGRRSQSGSSSTGQRDFNSSYQTVPEGTGSFQGYLVETNNEPLRVKAWGTNRVISPAFVPGGFDNGQNLLVETDNNDVLGLVTRFDRGLNGAGVPISDGSLFDEAQAAGGDSGGPVFFKDDSNEWVLGGVMHAIYINNNQPVSVSVFGNFTAFTDLSIDHYSDQIEALKLSNQYSIVGDVDLDGVVTGSIVNGEATGDLAELIDGWLYNQAEADIVSWKKGDLNQDGVTNIADFVMLRSALGGAISTAEFASLVNNVGVPEPSTLCLAMMLAAASMASRRRS